MRPATLLLILLLVALPVRADRPLDCGVAVPSGGVVSILAPGDTVIQAFVASNGGSFLIASVGEVAWTISTRHGGVLASGNTALAPASVEQVPPGHAEICVVATNMGDAPAPLATRYG